MTEHRETVLNGLSDDTAVLERISEDLTRKFICIFAAETVERYVFESYTALARTSRIRTYLAATTARIAADRLKALAQSKGAIAHDVPGILFVCVHNSGRSQMAAALMTKHARGAVHVRSAGSAPVAELEPSVVAALAEVGVDIAEEFPKPLTDDVVRAADVIITMGCGDSCPGYPGKRYFDRQTDDPAEKDLVGVRGVRDEIDLSVRELLTELIAFNEES